MQRYVYLSLSFRFPHSVIHSRVDRVDRVDRVKSKRCVRYQHHVFIHSCFRSCFILNLGGIGTN